MEKPTKEKYGYIESSGFDSEPSGFVIEGGEEAYNEALKQWQFMQDNGLSDGDMKTDRVVLFRGTAKGMIVEGYLLKWAGQYQIWTEDGHNYIIDPDSESQFIGITDKHGLKVFENDYVSVKMSNDPTKEAYSGKVIFINSYDSPGFYIQTKDKQLLCFGHTIEVITTKVIEPVD